MNSVWMMLAVAMTTASAEGPGGACGASADVRPDSVDVWLASTRRLSCDACSEPSAPDFWQLSAGGDWIEADQRAFLKSDRATIPTVFYIHGNRYGMDDAVQYGLNFCEELKGLEPDAKFRFVIWSWPADRITRRNRPDLVVKHFRSQQESVYVARLIDRLHAEVPVSLVGHSYGAQTICGTFRLLSGGEYAGCTLDRRATPRRAPLRGVLVAAAIEDDALAAADGAPSPLAAVDRLLVTRNCHDSVLRFYPHLCRPRGPEALGFVGCLRVDADDPNAAKVETIDLACEVGPHHDWDLYRQAASLRARLPFYTLLKPSEASGLASVDGE